MVCYHFGRLREKQNVIYNVYLYFLIFHHKHIINKKKYKEKTTSPNTQLFFKLTIDNEFIQNQKTLIE